MCPNLFPVASPMRVFSLVFSMLLTTSLGFLQAQSTYEININCGGNAYTSSTGVNYLADGNFDNGTVFSNTTVPINNTADQILYQTERYDNNLAYSFPVPLNGNYEVTLHFAEVFNKNQAVNKRVFDMLLEGNLVLDDYDIFASVGGYTPDVKTFQVLVSDGELNITSSSTVNKAKLCAIQIKYNPPVCNDPNHIPTVDTISASICSTDSLFVGGAYQDTSGFYSDTLLNKNACDSVVVTELVVAACTTPAFELGINCGGNSYTASNGHLFVADSLFSGGLTSTNLSKTISNTSDELIFQSERYAANLMYDITVPNGSYDVSLYFAEIFNKNYSAGKRVFDVFLEGSLVLDDYDIFADVGADAAVIKTFTINVTDQTLNITTTSSANNAKFCAIRVVSTPVDCQLGNWSAWSSCDVSCGGGTQFRTRPVLVQGANGGLPCGPTIEYRACNTQVCPVDCQVSAWGPWSACDASCGGGQQFRTRTVITPAANGGQACPNLIEYRACNSQACPVDCQVSAWGPWSACDASCGGGQQFRTRTVITPAANGGQACPNLIEYQTCNTQACASSGQCPKDTIVSTSTNSCDAVVHFPIDSSGISSVYSTANYQNVPLSLNDCPKNSWYGSSTLSLSPTGIGGTAMGSDVSLESVYIKMDHKRIGDLVIDLESPNGNSVRLLERPGKYGLYGNGGCNKDDIDAFFIPGTGNSAENDCSGNKPVLSGSYTAHYGHDLASMNDGSNPNGNWTLKVYDMRNKKVPTLKAWSLNFKSSSGSIIQIAGLPSGSSFPLGITTNTLVFIDSLGVKDTCSFNVTVEDITPPAFLRCDEDLVVCGDPVNWNAPTAIDNCGIVSVTQLNGPTPGSSLADGTYPVTYEATDAAGNTTSCTLNLVKAPLSVDAGSDKVIYTGAASGCELLFASVQNGQWPYTYSWSDGGTKAGNLVCPNSTTEYIVSVTDANGCTGTDTVNVEVIDVSCGNNKVLICYNNTTYCVNPWLAWYYTSFLSADYGSCQSGSSKKMGDPSQLQLLEPSPDLNTSILEAYPNPATSQATISWNFAEADFIEVGLYDLTGRRIMDIYKGACISSEDQSEDIRTDHLAPGVYLIIAKSSSLTKTRRLHIK
jgi:subtilisin-like proprotein convertase family protein